MVKTRQCIRVVNIIILPRSSEEFISVLELLMLVSYQQLVKNASVYQSIKCYFLINIYRRIRWRIRIEQVIFLSISSEEIIIVSDKQMKFSYQHTGKNILCIRIINVIFISISSEEFISVTE